MRTTPFDLKAALAGAEVITQDGRKVIDLKRFETVDRLYGVLNGMVTGWDLDGSAAGVKSSLCMVAPEPKIREVWLNLYPRNGVTAYETEKIADNAANDERIGKARRILISEEE